eukprot:9589996-Alexandrium_andersonii.AAC.1
MRRAPLAPPLQPACPKSVALRARSTPVSVLGTVARTLHVGAWIKALRPCAHARHAPHLFDTGPKYLLI